MENFDFWFRILLADERYLRQLRQDLFRNSAKSQDAWKEFEIADHAHRKAFRDLKEFARWAVAGS